MCDTGKKTKTAVIYIIITVMLAALASAATGIYNELHETYVDSFDYLESFVETYDTLLTREHDEETRARSDLKDIARLTVAAIIKSKSEILPSQYADGAIVRVTAAGIESPIDLPDEITPQVFSHDDTGTCDIPEKTMIFSHIKDDFYYVEMVDPVETAETADKAFDNEKSDVTGALEDLAAAHKCEYLYMEEDDDSSGDYQIYCATGQFREYSRLSQLHISERDMTKVNASIKGGDHHLIKIDGHHYFVRFINVGDSKAAAIIIPVRATLKRTMEQTILFAAAILVISIIIASWILFIYYAVENHTISLADRDRFSPRSVRIKVRTAVFLGAVIILVSSLFTQSLESVFTETSNGSAILTALFHRATDEKKRSDKLWQDSQDRYTAMADRVALLIDRNRELQNRDWLRESSKIIGAEYLMIFDTDGREVISDSPYKGLTLGESEDSPTYDFRRLLRGVKSISHAGVIDEVIEHKLDMYGISLQYLSKDDAYGALILAADPETSGKKDFVDMNEIAKSMMAEKSVCFAVDPETGLVKYSSDSSLLGKDSSIYGLNKKKLREDYMGSIGIKGRKYYVTSAQYDNLFYYYGVRSSEMLSGDIKYAVIMFLLSLGQLGGLGYMLLKGFREEDYMASFETDISSDTEKPVFHPKAADFMKDKVYSFGFLNKSASPDERTGALLLLCIAAVLMPLLIRVYSGKGSLGGEGSVLNYIGHGEWEHSINIFAVSSSMLILCQISLILITLKFIIILAGRFLGLKGHTVCTLLYNIVFCALAIAFVLISLEYFGVNTQALLASFGLAGLAASLGAKDFIADIIAGINLMIDGSYKVGDSIEIGGLGGTVHKINMRKTTVMDWRGTVKTFNNSTITAVVNHSVYPSVYVTTFITPQGCTAEEAIQLLNREFPKLKGKCPVIIDGPSCKGACALPMVYGTLRAKIEVQAVCKWGDRFTVEFFVNGEIKKIFEKEYHETVTVCTPLLERERPDEE